VNKIPITFKTFQTVGTTTILNEPQKEIPAVIDNPKNNHLSLHVNDLALKKIVELGFILFDTKKVECLPKNISYHHKEALFVEKLHRPDENTNKHKFIIFRLMQCAIERSFLKGYEGRIFLYSEDNFPILYDEIGMRFSSEPFNEILKKCLSDEKNNNGRFNFGSQIMFLPKESIRNWHSIILDEPILEETKKAIANNKFPRLISIGTTTILNKETKKQVPASIKVNEFGKLILQVNEFSLGHIKFYEKTVNTRCLEKITDYYNKKSIYVKRLRGSYHDEEHKKYKYIGTKLMQCAIETSFLKGLGGKVHLQATYDSPLFYYKVEMRSPYKSFNRILEKCLFKGKLDHYKKFYRDSYEEEGEDDDAYMNLPINFGSKDMFLPKDSIKNWHKKILENPILEKTKNAIANNKFPTLPSEDKK
jgi:hypothetical protein